MTMEIRFTVVAALTMGLMACGRGAKLGGGSQGAAQAAYEAGSAANEAGGLAAAALAAGQVNIGLTVSADCPKGGKVHLTYTITGDEQAGELSYDVKYDNCSVNGKTRYGGNMKMTLGGTGDGTNGVLAFKLKGKVTLSGAIDDFVDADVTQTITISGAGTDSASVGIVLTGTISTSTETYTYNNTTITFTAGADLPAADDSQG